MSSTTLQTPRQSHITPQYSSSTDEGCDTDHGDMDEIVPSSSSVPPSIQRLNSYASSSSSSGVVTNFHSKSLSQNLSCESSRSNFSTFESLDLNLSDCSDLAASLPSCATSTALAMADNIKDSGKYSIINLNSNRFISFHLLNFLMTKQNFDFYSNFHCVLLG